MFDSLQPHRLQYARFFCVPLSPRVCPDSCPLSPWYYLTISSSAALFFFCLQFFPASGSFLMSGLFSIGGQNTGASASASVLPMNIQDWFPIGLTGWISWQSKGLSSLLQHHKAPLKGIKQGWSMFFMHFRKITLEHCGEQFGKDQTRRWEADGVSAAVTQDGSEPW